MKFDFHRIYVQGRRVPERPVIKSCTMMYNGTERAVWVESESTGPFRLHDATLEHLSCDGGKLRMFWSGYELDPETNVKFYQRFMLVTGESDGEGTSR